MLSLRATVNGESRSWPLDAASLRIGRSSAHPVHLPDGTVSKDHAELFRDGDRWLVRDLGSRNGTRVNGADAREPLAIADGDMIEIGSVLVRVQSAAGGPALSAGEGLSSSLRLGAQEILRRPTASMKEDGRILHLLAEAGRLLVLPRPLHETCDDILRIVEQALPASRLLILLRERPDSEPVQVAGRYRGGTVRDPLAISRTILKAVLDDCVSVVTHDASADDRFRQSMSIVSQGVHSAMAVPLFDNEHVLGILYADSRDPRVTFDQAQLEVLTLLANMAAVKITNARLLEAEQARQRMAMELATATRIQRHLLPRAPEGVPGLECHARLETCFEVGGDLYDFYVREDGWLSFMVGDVSGKGMGAALLMSSVMSSARVLYDQCHDPAELVSRLNAVTHRSTESGHFVTLFLGCLDPVSGQLRYVNAGHNAPLVLGKDSVRDLPATGVPVAVLADFPYRESETVLAPGELLAVFTDGIPEAQHGDEFFDDARLLETLRSAATEPTLEAMGGRVIARVEEFLAGESRSDDITLLLIRRIGSS